MTQRTELPFEYFVKWSQETGEYENLIESREHWIAALEVGQNPFKEELWDEPVSNE